MLKVSAALCSAFRCCAAGSVESARTVASAMRILLDIQLPPSFEAIEFQIDDALRERGP
jgi:hypothetical protein